MSEKNPKRSRLDLVAQKGVSEDKVVAMAALSPEIGNAAAMVDWSLAMFPDLSLNECVEILRSEAEKVKDGDLEQMQSTLASQAQSRSTIEALHEMKYPRQAFFIGQQYNAEQQQVNNAIGTRTGGAVPKSASLSRNPSAHLEDIAIPKNADLVPA